MANNTHISAGYGTEPSIHRAAARLRAAIDEVGGEASIAILAPEPVATRFREFVETVRTAALDHAKLQTHMDDDIRKLEEDAKP